MSDLWQTYLNYLGMHNGLFSVLAWMATLNILWWTFVIVAFIVTQIIGGIDPSEDRRARRHAKTERLRDLKAQGLSVRQIHEELRRIG